MKWQKVLCITTSVLVLCFSSASAQSYGTSENKEYYESQEYHDTNIYTNHGKAMDVLADADTKTISFKLEYFFDGTTPSRDITFVIDKYTYIPEITSEISPDIDKFISGEHKWIDVYITPEEYAKITNTPNGDNVIVHVDRVMDICEAIAIYPNPEETARNERLKNYGIMVGDENGKFNPYQALTRAELTKIAVMMSNPDFMETVDLSKQSFSDLNSEHWSYPYVEYAKQSGIIDGYDDRTFKPETDVTVIEALKIIVNLLGYSTQAEQAGGYPSGYIKTAERLGLTNKIAVGYDKYTIRTEAADIINIALDLPLMVQTDDGEYVLCDGSNPEYPTMTLSLKNFSN